jgi:TATA-binding protein-associated factor
MFSGADTVIFLEHDWNPHVDLQAMDRAHRIGQKKTVNVYKLVTTDSIEEKIMKLHETKLAMSDAIVNAENSTLFSMGTDQLLDIFRFRSETADSNGNDMDSTLYILVERYEEEYKNLSLDDFVGGFQDRVKNAKS